MTHRRLARTTLLAAVALAGAAACAPGNPATPGTTISVVAPTSDAAPTSAPGKTGNAGSPGTPTAQPVTSPATGSPCDSGKLGVFVQGKGAGMGHTAAEIIFSLPAPDNISCTLTGYPGLDITDTTGTVHHADRTPRGYMGGLPSGNDTPPTVTISPGHPAHPLFEGTAAQNGTGDSCGTAQSTQVTPPDSTATQTFTTGVYLCNLQIHPVTPDDGN